MAKGQIPTSAFKGRGVGLKTGDKPMSVRFPEPISNHLGTMTGEQKQDFIRAAVLDRLISLGFLTQEIAKEIILKPKKSRKNHEGI